MKRLTIKLAMLYALLYPIISHGQIDRPLLDEDCIRCQTPSVSISGTTSVNLNSTYSYTVSASSGLHSSTSYAVSGGVITSQSRNSVSVRWTSTGSRWIRANAVISGSIYSSTKYVNVAAPLSGGSISASTSSTICSGTDPGTINNAASPSGGSGSFSYQWQKLSEGSDSPIGDGDGPTLEGIGGGSLGWSNISGATGSSYNPPRLYSNTTYRRRVTSGGKTAYSNVVSYSIPAVSAGSISYNGGNINVSATPSRITGTNASGGSVSYQWQRKVGTASSYSNISGATSRDYQPGSQTKTTVYRRRVVSCGQTKYSSAITIRVNLKQGSIAASTTTSLCYNGNPGTVNNSSSPSGGNGSFAYQWQQRVYSNGAYGSWNNVSGATSSSYNPPALTSSRKYKRRVISDGQTKYSNEITFSVAPNLNQGSISYSGGRTLNPGGNPSTISGSTPTGGNGSIAYQWQKKTTGGYSDVSGARSKDYNPGPLSVTTTFRRRTSSCGQTKYTNEIKFTINLVGGTVTASSNTSICPNTNPDVINNASAAAGASGLYSYQWQYLSEGGLEEINPQGIDEVNPVTPSGFTWHNISGATSASYNPPALLVNAIYRRKVTSGSSVAYSNSVGYTITSAVNKGSISYSGGSINPGATPAKISGSNATGGNGIAYRWQWKRGTESSFTNIPSNLGSSVTSRDYQPQALTKKTVFRRRVTSCGQNYYTNQITIGVNLVAGSISGNQTICKGSDPSNISSSSLAQGGNGSYSYKWEKRDYRPSDALPSEGGDSPLEGGGIEAPVGGGVEYTWSSWTEVASGTSYNPGPISFKTEYRRKVTSNGVTKYSNVITKNVYPDVDPSTISYSGGSINSGSTPNQISGGVATGGSSVSYQWQSKTTGGFTNIPGATDRNYQPDPLTYTTSFQRLASSNCGNTQASNSIKITVNLSPGSIVSGNELICRGSNPDVITSTSPATGGVGNYQYQWQIFSELGEGVLQGLEEDIQSPQDNWINLIGETNETFNPPVLNADAVYRRKVTSGNKEAFTGSKTFTVSTPLSAGSINYTGGAVNAGGNPPTITGTSASGGITPKYQWQEKVGTATGFTNISGATNKDYNPPSGIDYTTTYQRRVQSCGETKQTNQVTINVNFNAGSISGNQTICSGSAPSTISNSTLAKGGNGSYSYKWEKRDYRPSDILPNEGGDLPIEVGGVLTPIGVSDEYIWTDWAQVASGTSYNPGNVSFKTEYRRKVTSGGVTKYSNVVTVDLEELPDAGSISYVGGTINSGASAAQIIGSEVTSSSNFQYKWMKRITGAFVEVPNSNSRDFSPGVLNYSTSYVRIVENDCGRIVESNVVKVPVKLIAGNATTANFDVCHDCTRPTLSPANPVGGNGQYSYQWQMLGSGLIEGGEQPIESLGGNDQNPIPTGEVFDDIPLAKDASYTPNDIIWMGTRTFRRKVISDGQTTYSEPIDVTIHQPIVPGTISYNTDACQGNNLGTISGTLPTGGSNSYDYQWQYYTGSAWETFSNSNSRSFNPNFVITADTLFRRRVKSAGSGWKKSNELLIEIYDVLMGSELGTLSATSDKVCPNSKIEFTYAPGPNVNTNNTRLYGEKDGNEIDFGKIGTTKSIHVMEGFTYYVRYTQPCASEDYATNSVSLSFYENCNVPPSLDQNFVRTEVPKIPVKQEYDLTILDATEKSTSYTYSDGLGRPTMSVAVEAGQNFEDVIQFSKYNEEGRQDISYMPYYNRASIPGKFIDTDDAITQQENFYNASTSSYDDISHDSKPYSTTEWDSRGRVKSVIAPGEAWHNGNKRTVYDYAVFDPALTGGDAASIHADVTKWKISGGLPVPDGMYLAKELSVTSVTGVEGHKSRTVTDGRGLTITSQIYDQDQDKWIGSYNVYDNFGRVRFIVPPLLQAITSPTSDQIKELAFEYQYDSKGRVIRERAPGSGWVSYVYDQWNRLVLRRHQAQFVKIGDGPYPTEDGYKTWTFFKYDALNRQIMSGEVYDEEERNRAELQNLLDKNLVGDTRYETTNLSSSRGYTKYKSFPDLNTDYQIYEIHSVNYFDNYDFLEIVNWDAEDHDYALIIPPGFQNFGWAPEGYELVTENKVIKDRRLVLPGGNPPTGDIEHNGKYAKRPGVTITFEEGVVPGPEYEEIDAAEPYTNVINRPTGSKIKVLGSDTWLNAVVYYNERGRAIQTIAENHKRGTDRLTNDLDWKGELQKMLVLHESKNEHGASSDKVALLNEYEYAHNGQLLKTYQTIDEDQRILVAEYHYNILGELVEKNLHSENEGTSFLQSIDYRYNIRGAMTRINNADLGDGEGDIFGMEYYFETPLSINNNETEPRFDGMVSAMAWNANNNPGGDSDFNKTAIGFSYDKQSRLRSTAYGTGTSYSDQANANAYTMKVGELDANGKYTGGYDDNGNILALNRNSEKETVDELTYHYSPNSNKLDGVTDDATKEGFDDYNAPSDIKTLGTDEYTYNAMGNMTYDVHKEIELHYNHLQLVDRIDFVDGDKVLTSIIYTYDAGRNRLAKEVLDADNNSIAKVDYVGAVEYLDDEINQVFTPEGRAYKQNGDYHHEYFYTDHQGNNRVAFGNLPERNIYTATMEQSRKDYEKSQFKFPNDDIRSEVENHTPLGKGSIALNGTLSGRQVGPAKVLSISPGDEVEIEVWAKYKEAFSNSTVAAGIVTAISSAFNSASSGTGLESNSTVLSDALALPSDHLFANNNLPNNETRAYLQYIFFDANYAFKEEGTSYQEVTSASLGKFAKYESGVLSFDEPGYLFVYLVNETNENKDVYFDDLKITHSSTAESFKVSQVNDYYPFGLPTSNSWRSEGYIDPGLLYQSSYASYDSLTGYYDFLSRSYDPVLGRFFAVDPAGQYSSPYLGMGNAPHMGIDPNGEIFGFIAGALFAAAGQAGVQSLNGNGSFWDNVKNNGFVIGGGYSQNQSYISAGTASLGAVSTYNFPNQGSRIFGGFARPDNSNYSLPGPYQDGGLIAAYGFDPNSAIDYDFMGAMVARNTFYPTIPLEGDGDGLGGGRGQARTVCSVCDHSHWDWGDGGIPPELEGGTGWASVAQGSLATGEFFRNLKSFQFTGTNAVRAGNILDNRRFLYNGRTLSNRYYGNQHQGVATIRHAKRAFQSSARLLKGAGKAIGALNIGITGYQVYNDFSNGNYYGGGARMAVAGVAAGAAFIPVVGWGVAIGIGVADAIWGDRFYNYIENRFRN
ncbi:MAG: DUF6443 domain-containing protein [Ekhidna sp.]